MGMHLLQKMGWKPGEGLGKEKTGTLEPLLLEVKLDKKGIVAKEEQKGGKAKTAKGGKIAARVAAMQGKHPVSLLGEYASKHKLGAPQYSVCFECGPDHKKNFLFKVSSFHFAKICLVFARTDYNVYFILGYYKWDGI